MSPAEDSSVPSGCRIRQRTLDLCFRPSGRTTPETDDGPRRPSGSITPSPYAIVPCRASRPVKPRSRATSSGPVSRSLRGLAGPERTINARLRPVNSSTGAPGEPFALKQQVRPCAVAEKRVTGLPGANRSAFGSAGSLHREVGVHALAVVLGEVAHDRVRPSRQVHGEVGTRCRGRCPRPRPRSCPVAEVGDVVGDLEVRRPGSSVPGRSRTRGSSAPCVRWRRTSPRRPGSSPGPA